MLSVSSDSFISKIVRFSIADIPYFVESGHLGNVVLVSLLLSTPLIIPLIVKSKKGTYWCISSLYILIANVGFSLEHEPINDVGQIFYGSIILSAPLLLSFIVFRANSFKNHRLLLSLIAPVLILISCLFSFILVLLAFFLTAKISGKSIPLPH